MKFALLNLISSILLAANIMAGETNSPRERLLLDFGWKFHLGNEWGIAQNLAKAGTGSGPASMSFSDVTWRTVNLPHDWAVELPFDARADESHGFKALGVAFPQNSIAWYRRTFELPPEDVGKRLWLEFDGVFRDCDVFVNGWFIGHHASGYSSFHYDITDVANYGGKNVVAVKVDATQTEGWFYEGAGIYRHVWLVKTSPLAIAPDGIFVYNKFSNNIPEGPVEIDIQTCLDNAQTNPADATVGNEIINPEGQSIAKMNQSAECNQESESSIRSTIFFNSPELWSPENPKLYKLITTVESDGKIVDRKETEFGIRTVAFDPDKGFLLNGKPYELKGTCNHQDHAGVGSALPDRLQYFRVEKLKKMGCNAIRTSHNAPTPELLDACDQLGMLVMDENRLLGSDAANLKRLQDQILRDRNHPSLAIWSIANEEFTVQDTPAGVRVAETMQNLIKQFDPTRPITYPAPVGDDFNGINSVIQVRGWNYHVGQEMDNYHREHPNQSEVGTEQGSTVSTRGVYANDPARGYVSAYDVNFPSWASTAEQWWSYFDARPWLSGGFVWTGFDYRGEPTPYSWPCINSHFGIMDTCGFPKDNYYYYRAWWTTNTVLHLLPHWNWPGREGREIPVWAYSNCKEVELFLNGQSLGKQTMPKDSHLEWNVKYAPGTLSAKGFDADGNIIAETQVETTGDPTAVQLEPDRATINADGEDISIITVSVRDAQNRIVPTADNLIHFELSGPGKILGVGNGGPSCHEPDVYIPTWPSHAISVDAWRWERIANPYAGNFPEAAEHFDDSNWEKADVHSEWGPLATREHAIYRGKINLSDSDLAAENIELDFGRIQQDGWVFVNGMKAGESHNGPVMAAFDVKSLLHAGENSIAVVVANYNNGGGISRGVTLLFQEPPILPEWKRSVFNGLAQIIVQSTKTPGEIKLTAQADGLTPTTLNIQSQACAPRPCVP